jgi:hypothetical protein
MRASRSSVCLLPNPDAFLLGYRETGHVVDAAHYKRVYRKAWWIYPTVLVGGFVGGTWSLERKVHDPRVHVAPFSRPLSKVKEGIAAVMSLRESPRPSWLRVLSP